MVAVGCIVPFILMLLGAGIGAWTGGDRGGLIGLVAGFLIGAAVMALGFWSFERARNRD
jgi:hypothetical protein